MKLCPPVNIKKKKEGEFCFYMGKLSSHYLFIRIVNINANAKMKNMLIVLIITLGFLLFSFSLTQNHRSEEN